MISYAFDNLQYLRSKTINGQLITVRREDGFLDSAGCEWSSPISDEDLRNITEQYSLPLLYQKFLQITDGADLYTWPDFHQWGFRFYASGDLAAKQNYWREVYDIPTNLLVIGERIGGAEFFMYDMSQLTENGQDHPIVWAPEAESVKRWPTISRSLYRWIDQLIVAQGCCYWDWR